MEVKLIGENNYFGNMQGQFFKNRGIDNYLEFINLKNYKPTDTFDFYNMRKASQFLVDNQGKNLCVLEDYDMDGIASTGVIYNYVTTYMDFDVKVAQHKKKVHGIKMKELEEYGILEWADILIVPDAGTNDFEEHRILKEKYNIDVICIDHHASEKYSDHAIVINNQLSNLSKNLTGSAMSYKFIQALDYLLGEDGADDFLDIVALGLIGDMADIRDLEVQYLIRKGIENIKNDFFRTIVKENFNINENELSPTVLSFSIIPMINACTRVATFEEMQCITNAICNIDNGEDYEHTFIRGKRKGVTIKEDIYQHAHRVAQKVKSRQDSIVNKAFLGSKRPLKSGLIELLEARDVGNKDNKIIVVDVTGYIENSGLSGLLANKIMAQYDKPTLVLHRSGYEYRGSGRGNQIPMLRTRLKESKIVKFAEGHEPAFGVRIDADSTITEINDGLNDYFNLEITTDITSVDFIIDNNDIDNYLLKDFEALEEFYGTGLKPPLIYIENVLIKTNTINTGSKSNLLKFKYNDVDFVKFKMSEAQLEDLIPWDSNVCYNVLCTPNLNDFNGKRNMQLIIDKIEVVELYTGEEKKEEDTTFEW